MGNADKRPIIVVPPGLKDWYMAQAYPEGVIPFHEICEVDPTRPGHEEFEEALGKEPDPPAPEPDKKEKPHLVLITCKPD